MRRNLRRAMILQGVVLALCLGWVGYIAGGPFVRHIYPDATTDEARLLGALLCGLLGLFLGAALGGPGRDVVRRD